MIRRLGISLLCLALCHSAKATEDELEIVSKALDILNPWYAQNPKPSDRKLHIICWRPIDRDYAKNYRQRLRRIMEHIRNFYADEMERTGFGRRTFQLNYDEFGELIIHEAIGDSKYSDYTKPEGERIRQDCWPVLKAAGINPDRETVLLFTNLSDWDPVKKTFVHKSPYYAKGSNLAGLAWQLDSPELDTANLELSTPMIHDADYGEISLGKHNSIFIGGIAHELGHALGLPHGRENSDKDKTALMGLGNLTYGDEIRGEGSGSFITLAHALRLASHPQFSGSVKGLNLPVKANFSSLSVTGGSDHFVISGNVWSSVPVYAVIAYLDPDGSDDYDSRTAVTVPDADGTFSIKCSELVPGKPAQLRLTACLANGAVTTWQSTYRVDEDGTPNVEALETVLDLGDFVDALNRNDDQSAKLFRDRFDRNTRNYKICSEILAGKSRNTAVKTLNEVSDDAGMFPLSRLVPKNENVGWWRPAYNHIPNESLLLISAGEVFTTGIYAHSESRHIYEIDDGNWSHLKGKCGLPPMRSGSVVFVIKTDGKEVYRSEVVRPNECTTYRIDLTGVSELELLTEDAGDGKASDWGMWFDPILHR